MSADRLDELLRQRALLQQHLAWLDREIEATTHLPHPTRSAARSVRTPPAPPAPTDSPSTGPALAAADVILERYRTPPGSLHQDVRKGCFLYLAAGIVLLIFGVVLLYFMIGTRE